MGASGGWDKGGESWSRDRAEDGRRRATGRCVLALECTSLQFLLQARIVTRVMRLGAREIAVSSEATQGRER